jgi:hypothetical protein
VVLCLISYLQSRDHRERLPLECFSTNSYPYDAGVTGSLRSISWHIARAMVL